MCSIVQGSAPERIEEHVCGRLADRQLARGRPPGERRSGLARLGGDERTKVRHAHAALAGSRSAERGTLDQLDVLEALVPHHLQIVDGHLRTRAYDARGRAGRQLEVRRR